MKLPTILCGPILRRVEPSCVYVWIALSRKLDIDAQLFHINFTETSNAYKYIPLAIKTDTTTIKAGEKLYVSLIKISSTNAPFPPYTLLGYNLLFKKGRRLLDLGSFGLLSPGNPHSIVYGKLKYPAFYIDHEGEPTKLLYGSCRKPHGSGSDALSAADTLMEETHLNLSERTNALFMMGDQIYADDVADPLIPILIKIGRELSGTNEDVLLNEPLLIHHSLAPRINQVNGRQYLIEHLAKFTTRHGDNHLIRFSEYAAMYSMVWSPELWHTVHENELLLTFQQVKEEGLLHLKFENDEKIRKKELAKLETRYEEQLDNLREIISTVSAARRIMANTPTYMIFDDHDLTDDWNISLDWTSSVNHSPFGKHIIANGLAAYWLFQGWGNDPENFDRPFFQSVRKYLEARDVHSVNYEEGVNMLWDFHSWDFVAPTVPNTIFLDTRTQREFDPRPKPVKLGSLIEETTRTPLLISHEGWNTITKKLFSSGWKQSTPLTIVSPSPFYGMGLIETFLHKYVYPFKVLGFPVQTSFDFDAWKYNGKGFNEFIKRVGRWNPSYCILLSGDVHFSSSVKSDIHYNNGKQLSFYQFTSSPIDNESFTGIWGVLMKMVLWFNARKRKTRPLFRSCDDEFNLKLQLTAIDSTPPHLWKETIQYLPYDDKSIIETKNSIGSLKIKGNKIENTLIMPCYSHPFIFKNDTDK